MTERLMHSTAIGFEVTVTTDSLQATVYVFAEPSQMAGSKHAAYSMYRAVRYARNVTQAMLLQRNGDGGLTTLEHFRRNADGTTLDVKTTR